LFSAAARHAGVSACFAFCYAVFIASFVFLSASFDAKLYVFNCVLSEYGSGCCIEFCMVVVDVV